MSWSPSTNEDLWTEAADLLQVIPAETFMIQRVNSHLDANLADDPLEEWIRQHNAYADEAAEQAHALRPTTCAVACSQHRAAVLRTEAEIDMLRALHLDVAASWQEAQPLLDGGDEADEEAQPMDQRAWLPAEDWLDAIPLGWQKMWQTEPRCDTISLEIAQQVVQIFTVERSKAEGAIALSWLEIAFMLHLLDFDHPCLISSGGNTVWRQRREVAPAQDGQVTCAARIRFLKQFFKLLEVAFQVDVEAVSGLDVSRLCVHPPQQGLLVFASRSTQLKIDEAVKLWTMYRPVKTSNDLTRPVWDQLAARTSKDMRGCTADVLCTMHHEAVRVIVSITILYNIIKYTLNNHIV